MVDSTRSSIAIDAAPARVMAVIADVATYPEWAGEVKEAEVLSSHDDGRADRVRFVLEAGPIRDEHVLRYSWDGERRARWKLESSQVLRALNGAYTLAPGFDGTTQVSYELTVDLKVPLLAIIKRKAEKRIIDQALSGLKRRVESGT
ncbi:cyclase [Mangrovactinospora gilvigrisea]|uniref:Cyclase n=1 Tax=Mangrovactinospora gilvigrisea TaxID=1428644 RepID=A0A1J7BA96_9ACTN|nr:SRPBCC family protein [Mangrovactinospora gilvigrisea]OIV35615.1 cyclase [Mangrovactinospora gilvigrisea]